MQIGYNVLDAQGFRLNVAIVLINSKGCVLLAKRFKQNAWQVPQGGVNDKEEIVTALYRELEEEIGLTQKDVTLIASTKHWLRYKIPVKLRRPEEPLFVGQKQKWFLLKLNTDDSRIRLDFSQKQEFDDWQWVSYWYPLRTVIDFKRSVYRRALKELSQYLGYDINYQNNNLLDSISL